jgi:hypothetical protein
MENVFFFPLYGEGGYIVGTYEYEKEKKRDQIGKLIGVVNK